jgi:microcystin-dependent protein
VAFAGEIAPPGWLLCDGRSVSRTTYNNLWIAIGRAHGTVDSSTFNLPDYRGRFLRGVDGGALRDPESIWRTAMNANGYTGNTVGTVQGDSLKAHTHWVAAFYGGGSSASENDQIAAESHATLSPYSIQSTPSGSSETRPLNAYVNWIIKY